MNRFLLALCFISFTASSANLTLDPVKSRVGFTYQQMGSSLDGEFKRYTAQVEFDVARPAAGHVTVKLDTAGVDAGLADVNVELLRPAFFDVGKYPEARFESTRITPLAHGRYDIEGKLTIKGITRPIKSRAQIKADGAAYRVTGAFNFKRLDFGIGTGIWSDDSVLGNDIQVTYALRLLRAPAAKKQ